MKVFDSEAYRNEILMGYFVKVVVNLYKCAKAKVYSFCNVKTVNKIY